MIWKEGGTILPSFLFETRVKMMKPVLHSFLLVLLLSVVVYTPSLGVEVKNWQQLLHESRLALKHDDSSYALYKLRQAWLAVPDQNLQSDAFQKIRKSYADACEKAGFSQKAKLIRGGYFHSGYRKCSMKELDSEIRKYVDNMPKGEFSVKYSKDRTLNFYANDYLYAPTAGYCATGSKQNDAAQPKALTLLAKEQLKKKKLLMSKMPIIFRPDSKRYNELLSLCEPIKPGEQRKIDFDLNPFISKPFKTNSEI